MRTQLIKFLLEKKSQGKPMMIGEGMSKLDITIGKDMSAEMQLMNSFRTEFEKNG